MTLTQLLDTRRHQEGTGMPTPQQAEAAMRKAVADGLLLEGMRQGPGWPVFEREIRDQIQRDKDQLARFMATECVFRFLIRGRWKLAARIAGMERVLETLDNVIAKGVVAEQKLASMR